MIISKTESLSASTTTSMGIWPRNVGEKRERDKKMFQMQQRRTHYQELQRKAINEESNDEDDKEKDKKYGFGEDLKQTWYERSHL